MSELQALLRRLSVALERSQVPFMIVGSLASAAHGLPRATQDLDIVIDPPNLAALDALLAEFPAEVITPTWRLRTTLSSAARNRACSAPASLSSTLKDRSGA